MYLTKKENGSKKSQGQLSHDRKDNPAPITLFNRGADTTCENSKDQCTCITSELEIKEALNIVMIILKFSDVTEQYPPH